MKTLNYFILLGITLMHWAKRESGKNEKKFEHTERIPRNFDCQEEKSDRYSHGKTSFDKFDLEAEREGSAVRRHTVVRSAWGKGTIKSRRGRKDAEAAIERRTIKGYYSRSEMGKYQHLV